MRVSLLTRREHSDPTKGTSVSIHLLPVGNKWRGVRPKGPGVCPKVSLQRLVLLCIGNCLTVEGDVWSTVIKCDHLVSWECPVLLCPRISLGWTGRDRAVCPPDGQLEILTDCRRHSISGSVEGSVLHRFPVPLVLQIRFNTQGFLPVSSNTIHIRPSSIRQATLVSHDLLNWNYITLVCFFLITLSFSYSLSVLVWVVTFLRGKENEFILFRFLVL